MSQHLDEDQTTSLWDPVQAATDGVAVLHKVWTDCVLDCLAWVRLAWIRSCTELNCLKNMVAWIVSLFFSHLFSPELLCWWYLPHLNSLFFTKALRMPVFLNLVIVTGKDLCTFHWYHTSLDSWWQCLPQSVFHKSCLSVRVGSAGAKAKTEGSKKYLTHQIMELQNTSKQDKRGEMQEIISSCKSAQVCQMSRGQASASLTANTPQDEQVGKTSLVKFQQQKNTESKSMY